MAKTKTVAATMPDPKPKIEPDPVKANPPADDDGRVPQPEAPKKRGRPPGSKNKPRDGSSPSDGGDSALDPELVKALALAPLALLDGIAQRAAGVKPQYPEQQIEATQRQFVRWVDSLSVNLGPGWQYIGLVCLTGVIGMRNAIPVDQASAEAAKPADAARQDAPMVRQDPPADPKPSPTTEATPDAAKRN